MHRNIGAPELCSWPPTIKSTRSGGGMARARTRSESLSLSSSGAHADAPAQNHARAHSKPATWMDAG